MKNLFVFGLCCLLSLTTLAQTVYKFDDFHKEGADGFQTMADILKIVKAQNGKPCVVEMSPKTYKFGKSKNHGAFISLIGFKNLTIDGKGAKIRYHRHNNFCVGTRCENVVIKNFDASMNKVSFAQGDIIEVNEDHFVFDIDKGYPLPPTDEFTQKNFPDQKWRWGSVMNRQKRAIKENFIDHIFMAKVEQVGGRKFKVYPRKDYLKYMSDIVIGDVWVMPVYKEINKNFGAENYTVSFVLSKDILIENVKISATRHAGFAGSNNKGKITFRNCTLTWRNSNDMISSWRDGSHFKNNKIGPTLENCVFEGMLDDAINISSAPAFVIKKINDTSYQMRRTTFFEGNDIALMYGETGDWVEGFKATKGSIGLKLCVEKPLNFTMWQEISAYDIVSGNSKKNSKATQFFNMSYINNGFVIRNCKFGVQRRYSMIIRAHNGIIENNTITGGTGIMIANEFGSWFEGPLPHNIVLRNNVVNSSVARNPFTIAGNFPAKTKCNYNFNITVQNNTVYYNRKMKYVGILVRDCKGIKLEDNKFFNLQKKPLDAKKSVYVSNATDVEIK
ncbi:MAG: hypothetical protein E7035_06415 [Verrucomicrobiaceae bacterium]|nr:hypothetical protein [Verrucomicrobiaceae bacterium]